MIKSESNVTVYLLGTFEHSHSGKIVVAVNFRISVLCCELPIGQVK